MFRWINGHDPRQYGLNFGLWTRSLVAELIERKFAIRLGVTAVGELLAKLGLTPQKPLQRAYQRDPEAIEAWRLERYPAIARQAKASGGEVYFWDESGFRADSVHGRTWGKQGQTPVVERPGQRQSISAASAVNARGGFWYCTYQGGLNAEAFVSLLRRMMRRRSKPVHLVLDGLPAHKTTLVKDYVQRRARLRWSAGRRVPHDGRPAVRAAGSWPGVRRKGLSLDNRIGRKNRDGGKDATNESANVSDAEAGSSTLRA